uniref:Uncharacterized protein n=1 Tax=Anguilla anguilla TaxID=7936 RepID=A0A0E9XWB8_ANGAN
MFYCVSTSLLRIKNIQLQAMFIIVIFSWIKI